MDINSKNCIVAYLDILGYESLINSDRRPEDVYKIFKTVITDPLEHSKNESRDKKTTLDALKIQVLSDSIIFILDLEEAARLEDANVPIYQTISDFFYWISIFTIQLTSSLEYFVRGGIDVGAFFQKDLNETGSQFIYSKTLVNAFNLEEESFWPRILISDRCHKYVTEKVNFTKSNPPTFIRENDGTYFVDTYSYLKEIRIDVVGDWLRKIKIHFSYQLRESSNKLNILKKYHRYSIYHNESVLKLAKDSKFNQIDMESLILDTSNYLSY